jgi:hypothetical protein
VKRWIAWQQNRDRKGGSVKIVRIDRSLWSRLGNAVIFLDRLY